MSLSIYGVIVLFVGGALKGVIGLGLPQIGVPLLTFSLGLKGAVSLLVLPIIVSNLTQSFTKQLLLPVVRRFWPLLSLLFCFVVVSTRGFSALPERTLFAAIGAALVTFTTIAYLKPTIRVTRGQERWLGPLVGIAAGFIGGVSSLPGPPLMIYLACLRLPKDEFVAAVSLMFLVASVALGLGLFTLGATDPMDLARSLAACIPVLLGMWLGGRVRVRISEQMFSRLVLITYLLTGSSFLIRAIMRS